MGTSTMVIRRRKTGISRHSRIVELLSRSPEETHRLGVELARTLPVPGVLLLQGSLGTGKTTLTRGVAEGLGLQDGSLVHSPSYTLVNIYNGSCPIYHVDLYRLSGERDLRSVGLDEFLGSDGITIVEWSERLKHTLASALRVELMDLGGDTRRIRVCYPPLALRPHKPAARSRKQARVSPARSRTEEGSRKK